jgi:hypothetical protein
MNNQLEFGFAKMIENRDRSDLVDVIGGYMDKKDIPCVVLDLVERRQPDQLLIYIERQNEGYQTRFYITKEEFKNPKHLKRVNSYN